METLTLEQALELAEKFSNEKASEAEKPTEMGLTDAQETAKMMAASSE